MPQFIRHHVNDTHGTSIHSKSIHSQSIHSTWALPILAGILVGCLLAFIANHFLKDTRWASNATKVVFVFSTAPESKPGPEFKKPVRYEAVISNWKKYRAIHGKE